MAIVELILVVEWGVVVWRVTWRIGMGGQRNRFKGILLARLSHEDFLIGLKVLDFQVEGMPRLFAYRFQASSHTPSNGPFPIDWKGFPQQLSRDRRRCL